MNFDQIPALLSMCDPSLTTRMNVKYLDNSKHYFVQFTNPNDESESLSQSYMNILEELRNQYVNNNKNATVAARRKKDMKNHNKEYDDISNAFVSNTQNQEETKSDNRKRRKASIESTDLAEEDESRRAPMEEKKEWYNKKDSSNKILVVHSKKLKEVTVPKNYTLVSEYKLEQWKDENSRMELELSLWAHEYDDIDAGIARGLKDEVERLKNLLKKEECRRKESESKYKEVARRFKEVENDSKIIHKTSSS